MKEKFILLLEQKLSGQISEEDNKEFESIISQDKSLKSEYEEQLKIKEALNKMRFKNPSNETWDNYWLGIYNKLERKFAWLAIIAGSLMIFSIAVMQAVKNFLKDTSTPPLVKYGIVVLLFGILLLFFSIIREKLFTKKHDKYKEIQR